MGDNSQQVYFCSARLFQKRIRPSVIDLCCSRPGFVRLRPPQVRDGLPWNGVPGMCGGGGALLGAHRRAGRAESAAAPFDLAPAMLCGPA